MKAKQAILVLGMHRSGTSLLSGVLEKLGVFFGDNLLPPMPGVNEKGFWEHRRIVELHEALLDGLGSAWYDVRSFPDGWLESEAAAEFKKELKEILLRDFSEAELWGVKDPRLCLFIPLWKCVLDDLGVTPKFVLVQRNPLEIAMSLAKRDMIFPLHAIALTQRYLGSALGGIGPSPLSRVFYHHLLGNWIGCVRQIGDDLGIDWPVQPGNLGADADGLIEEGLCHQRVDELSMNLIGQLVARAMDWKSTDPNDATLADSPLMHALESTWKKHHAQLKAAQERIERLGAELSHARRVVEERDGQLKAAQERIERLGAELSHARGVVEERDKQLADLHSHWFVKLGKALGVSIT